MVVTGLHEVQESGFWGRERELWDIQSWFVGGTRRLVVHGFGGEGKTYLAARAGRWLMRIGLFEHVCFVDYKSFQGVDACAKAVSTLGTALGQNLLDAEAVTAALQATPTLLILDNLEAVPAAAAAELLTAARAWSEAGESRVLVTTRQPELKHHDWPTNGSNRCRYLDVKGLQPDDALAWFQALMVPLPDREALITLFTQVDFHPLSIGVLAELMRTCRFAEVGERLEAILKTETNPLIASLNLSIERLAPELRVQMPKLGVFQGGALEWAVNMVTQLSAEQWAAMRLGLEQTGLIRAEALPNFDSSYLRFHPTLAPALWARLGADDRTALTAHHREVYYQLSNFLYTQDSQAVSAVRAITRVELRNLMAAVSAALAAGAPEAADFADVVARFLGFFGLARDREALVERAQAVAGEMGSRAWYLTKSQLGERLSDAGRFAEAEKVFVEVLAALGGAPSYDRCGTLVRLARCQQSQGRPDHAETLLRRTLAEIDTLEQTAEVRRLIGALQNSLGNAFQMQGDLVGARQAYETGLEIARELRNNRSAALSLSSLGAVAILMNDLGEAEEHYKEALTTFQTLDEPATVANCWHSLGGVYRQQQRWEDAERAYRESARLWDETDDIVGAAGNRSQLAQVLEAQNKFDEAEELCGTVLAALHAAGDRAGKSRTLYLLRGRPGRLADARRDAEQALAIQRTLDPATTDIWITYYILAQIADAEGRADEARAFRRQERHSSQACVLDIRRCRRRNEPCRADSTGGPSRWLRSRLESTRRSPAPAVGWREGRRRAHRRPRSSRLADRRDRAARGRRSRRPRRPGERAARPAHLCHRRHRASAGTAAAAR